MGPKVDPSEINLPTFSPQELLGMTFLHTTEDGQTIKAQVKRQIGDQSAQDHRDLKFLVELGDGTYEEIVGYIQLCDIIEEQSNNVGKHDLFAFEKILDHHGPLKSSDKDYNGSSYNLKILWTDGSITWEPLYNIINDNPLECAKYAVEHKLLNSPGWKKLRSVARKHHLHVNKLKSFPKTKTFKFGVQVPNNSKEAASLDAKNGTNKWRQAEIVEIDQLNDYGVFKDLGKGAKAPEGYKRIRVHLVYNIKHDLRHKARCVADGHLTAPCGDSYSGVISLRTLRLALTIGELNGLKVMVGDIGNAYLEAYTNEKVYIIAGPEFGELEGHTLVIEKALYGLRTSGARFHEKLADTLRNMGFFPCKSDADLWIRDAKDCYEYVCVYVDDLMAIMKDPQEFFNLLTDKYQYKLKGVGEPKYHLGGDFARDPDGTLLWGAKSYIKRLMENYKTTFGDLPKQYSSPLEHGDSPELDTSVEVGPEDQQIYQSLIGALQWCITLGRFDIACAVMTMSRFRIAPRKGHLERVKRICGYLRKKDDGAIRFRTGIPANEQYYTMGNHDWMHTIYGDVSEEIAKDIPSPKGKPVRTTTFVDANLYHCKITGRSVTGILHILNQTPIDWFSKRQNTVETATFGSEFVAARICTEQIIDLRITLRDMGVPIDGPAWMLGDNQSVITSSTIPHSVLNKRHNALAYHRVRAAVAARVLYFCYVSGKENVADIMTKFLPYVSAWPLIQPILFCQGETIPVE